MKFWIIEVRDQKIKLYRDQNKNFIMARTGTEKKLPGPGPNKKSYPDLERDRDQKKLVPHISTQNKGASER